MNNKFFYCFFDPVDLDFNRPVFPVSLVVAKGQEKIGFEPGNEDQK